MLLNEEISRELIREGLDHLTVSVDAADPSLLSGIRRGADLAMISENIARLNQLKRVLQRQNPFLALHIVVLMSNFHQLPELIRLARQWEIAFVILYPIIAHGHIPEIQQEALRGDIPRWQETLETCMEEAELRGITLDAQRLVHILHGHSPEEVYKEIIPCPEPFRFMGIRANGDVFPCCNWNVDTPVARIHSTPDLPLPDLKEAWQSPGWQALRERIVSGKYPKQCRQCMSNFTRPFHDENLGDAMHIAAEKSLDQGVDRNNAS